ncbi:hypothetical protein RO3G_01806 [Rhizopus delemar RA 99-880]|uniref:Uncharacterized protein n=1 Tax=Rhizopus delemar (strain RA 99-880 / ATCC MYA-4621 / FGSC 9543 / NRRL 43880) TaxID=246409 RepID=I1BLM2_RHIO9|nr:hypothetical protein RO3G_01806 [Rhizopus delemar RA 99-880]|eukprot:EIE77102.1 hypothetical protein RO3G_01806 [Rhizopus delemar RA 99-880]
MTSEIDNPMEVDIHYLQQRKNQRICGGCYVLVKKHYKVYYLYSSINWRILLFFN